MTQPINKKRQFEAISQKTFEEIKQVINGFLDKVKNGKTHLISEKEFDATEDHLKKSNVDVKIKMGLQANLRVVKKHMDEFSNENVEPRANKRSR